MTIAVVVATPTADVAEATIAVASTSDAPATAAPPDLDPGRPVTDEASGAFEFNDGTLAERSWAFDGTLVALSTGTDSQLGEVPTTTITVNRWFRGGTGDEVMIQYDQGPISEYAPTAGTGTRLLVAGEPRWGGEPLDDAVAWGCGFTQPWTSSAAEQWSTVFGA